MLRLTRSRVLFSYDRGYLHFGMACHIQLAREPESLEAVECSAAIVVVAADDGVDGAGGVDPAAVSFAAGSFAWLDRRGKLAAQGSDQVGVGFLGGRGG
jgi:hypothetical protein